MAFIDELLNALSENSEEELEGLAGGKAFGAISEGFALEFCAIEYQ